MMDRKQIVAIVKRIAHSATVVATGTMIGACSSAPDCASSSNLKQVDRILSESESGFQPAVQMMLATRTGQAKRAEGRRGSEVGDQTVFRIAREIFNASSHKFDTVRTTSKDPATGTVQCVANMDVEFPNNDGGFSADVKYKIERTADGRDSVSVFMSSDRVSGPRPPK